MDERLRRGPGRRLTVAQAADQLGISMDAVRARIKRRTIAHEREGGRVYVLLDDDQDRPGRDQPTGRPDESNSLISQLRDEVAYLREENRRKDHIIAGLVERIPPQLEAPSDLEARESPETVAEAPERTEEPHSDAPGRQEGVQRPWWRRVFGG